MLTKNWNTKIANIGNWGKTKYIFFNEEPSEYF